MASTEPVNRYLEVDFGDLEEVPCALCGSRATRLVVVQPLFGEDFHIVRCADCRLMYTNPRPTQKWQERFYDPQYNPYMRQMERDFVYRPEPRRLPAYQRLLVFLGNLLPPGAKLLDIGSAAGQFVKLAQDAGFAATGSDCAPGAVAYARRHFGLEMLQAGVYNLPVPDNTYEVVTLLHVFEHFRDPLAALQELKRVLKPGGLVVIETVNYSLHYWLEKQLKFLQPLYLSESGKDLIPWFPFDHYYFWTPASLLRAFSQAGLTCGRSHFLSNYKSEMPGGQVSSLYRLYSAGVGLLFHLSSRRLNLWNVLLATAMKP